MLRIHLVSVGSVTHSIILQLCDYQCNVKWLESAEGMEMNAYIYTHTVETEKTCIVVALLLVAGFTLSIVINFS